MFKELIKLLDPRQLDESPFWFAKLCAKVFCTHNSVCKSILRTELKTTWQTSQFPKTLDENDFKFDLLFSNMNRTHTVTGPSNKVDSSIFLNSYLTAVYQYIQCFSEKQCQEATNSRGTTEINVCCRFIKATIIHHVNCFCRSSMKLEAVRFIHNCE